MIRVLAFVFVAALLATAAPARDDGRYAQSPYKPFFDSLKNQKGQLCCSDADGQTLTVDQVRRKGSGWEIKLGEQWIEVPFEAYVRVPNIYGRPVVWPKMIDGKLTIFCFIPDGNEG